MTRVFVAPLAAAFTLIALASAMGQGSNPAPAEKPIPFFCPVAGMPEAKECACPGGYCSRRPVPRHTVAYKGAKLQLCCGECDKVFKDSPAKFAAVANHQLVATKQARQVKCPSCAGKIDPAVVMEVAGVKIGFCSEECRKKAFEAPAKDRVNLIFGDAPFARGFSMVKAEPAPTGKAGQ